MGAFEKAKEALNILENVIPKSYDPQEPFDIEDLLTTVLARVDLAKSKLSEAVNAPEIEKQEYEKLYQAVRKCVLNRYPYEDESGIIKIQLGNFAELLKAYEEIKTKLDNSNQKV